MRNHKNSSVLTLLLLLVVITTGYVASTYAKYTAEVTGNGTAVVAKWAFATDNAITSIDVELDETYDATTLVADKIAPGTSGSFAIALNNENSEVGVDFTVMVGAITNAPKNLKFYKDSAHTTEITPGTTQITGQLVAGETTPLNVNIYWAWEYYTTDANDALDTTDGEAGATLTIPVTVTGVQTQPSTTAITSHID